MYNTFDAHTSHFVLSYQHLSRCIIPFYSFRIMIVHYQQQRLCCFLFLVYRYLLSYRQRSTTRYTSYLWWHTITRKVSYSFLLEIHSFTPIVYNTYTFPLFAVLSIYASLINNNSCYLLSFFTTTVFTSLFA